jgi:hypothetical protein
VSADAESYAPGDSVTLTLENADANAPIKGFLAYFVDGDEAVAGSWTDFSNRLAAGFTGCSGDGYLGQTQAAGLNVGDSMVWVPASTGECRVFVNFPALFFAAAGTFRLQLALVDYAKVTEPVQNVVDVVVGTLRGNGCAII